MSSFFLKFLLFAKKSIWIDSEQIYFHRKKFHHQFNWERGASLQGSFLNFFFNSGKNIIITPVGEYLESAFRTFGINKPKFSAKTQIKIIIYIPNIVYQI